MSQTTFIAPVETIRGKLTSHRADDRVLVNRRKCFGKDAKGRPYYGPSETYIYHIHQGKWAEGAEQNRTLFQQVQEIVKQELVIRIAWRIGSHSLSNNATNPNKEKNAMAHYADSL